MTHRLPLVLDVFSSKPLYEQLADELKQSIESGRLTDGEKLPSIRELSRQLQLSKVTISEALNRLIDSGLIVAKAGSGNYVAGVRSENTDESSTDKVGEIQFALRHSSDEFRDLSPSINWSAETKRIASALNEVPFHPWWQLDMDFEFRVGESALEFMRGSQYDRAVETWISNYAAVPKKNSAPGGMLALREEVCRWLKRTRNIDCFADDVIITSGAQQVRDLCARLLVTPGAVVVLEEPGSVTDALAYAAQGASIVHVLQDRHGVDVDALEKVESATVAHLMTAANFPTGATLSLERRQRVLDWAQQFNSVIVEDSYGAGYGYEDTELPSLYQLGRQRDEEERVIYCGSLSQLFSPALRIGFAIVPKWLQRPYLLGKWLSDRHASVLMQELALTLLQSGFFDEHHMKLMEAGRRRRKALLDALNEWPAGLIDFTPVKSGFQQAIWFKEDIDDLLVYERALNQRIGVNPLALNYFAAEPRSGLSLNFVRMPEAKIREGMEKLLQIILRCRTAKV